MGTCANNLIYSKERKSALEVWQLTPWEELDMALRLRIAAFSGGLIVFEREHAEKPAGLRTLLLVCVGSALITIVSIYGFGGASDAARVAAGVVVGIGFLGAGTIIRSERGVVGITTAATIWTVAAIGLAVGSGLYLVGVVTAVIALIALLLLTPPRHNG